MVRKGSDLEAGAAEGEAETDSLLIDDAQPGSHGRAAGLRARRVPAGSELAEAAKKWGEEEEDHSNPTVDGELPLRALAQGLSLLSLDELRRLHLPSFPWQTGSDGSPSLIESLRKKPWKAHYTTALGFVLSSRACPAEGGGCTSRARARLRRPPSLKRAALTRPPRPQWPSPPTSGVPWWPACS